MLDRLAEPLQERGIYNVWMFEEQDRIQVRITDRSSRLTIHERTQGMLLR